jgi:SOS-response transcriptional repressor LexA
MVQRCESLRVRDSDYTLDVPVPLSVHAAPWSAPVFHCCFRHTSIPVRCLHLQKNLYWLTAHSAQKLNLSMLVLLGEI